MRKPKLKLPWPSFERVPIAVDHLLKGRELPSRVIDFGRGVPRVFFHRRYRSLAQAQWVEVPGRRQLVWFGNSRSTGRVVLDAITGEVLEIIEASNTPRVAFINTSLDAFARTAEAALARFPFYSRDDELEARRRVAEELSAAMTQIDPLSMRSDQFWSTFVDDVEIGDFATEAYEPPRA